MTEQDWLDCIDPTPMLEFLRDKASDRKLRLFAVACCQLIHHLLLDDRLRLLLDGFEREADGQATSQDRALLEDWWEELQVLADTWGLLEIDDERRRQLLNRPQRAQTQNVEALQAVLWVRDWDTATLLGERGLEQVDGLHAASGTAHTVALASGDALATRVVETALLRDIFGSPFSSVTLDHSCLAWNKSTVGKLTQGIYDDRAFDRLPILADALEDSGCNDADILGHCRQPGPHVRGCWVVDLLTGRK